MILIDSDVAIHYLRGEPKVTGWVKEMRSRSRLGVSSIVAAEILRGGLERRKDDAIAAQDLVDSLTIIPFGPRHARVYGQMMATLDKAGAPIPTVDGLIAAVSMAEGMPIATANTRHFDRVQGLDVLTP